MIMRLPPWIWFPLLAAIPCLAFSPLDWGWAAWVGFAPLVWALSRNRLPDLTWPRPPAPGKQKPNPRRPAPPPGGLRREVLLWLALSWGWGVVYYTWLFSWLPEMAALKGGVPWHISLGFTAFAVGVLACYPAGAVFFSRMGRIFWGVSPAFSLPPLFALQEALVSHTLFGGVAWGSLAATQTATLPARWLAPLAGGPAVTFALAASGAGWAWWAGSASGVGPVFWRPSRPQTKHRTTTTLQVYGRKTAFLALAGLAVTPWISPFAPPGGKPLMILPENNPKILTNQPGSLTEIPAVLATANIPLEMVSDPARADELSRIWLARTLPVLNAAQKQESPPRRWLVVWPESAISGQVEHSRRLELLAQWGELYRADFLLGSNNLHNGEETNAAYLVKGNPPGYIRYEKRMLVPFGEYMPGGFGPLFKRKLTPGQRDYTPGRLPPVMEWRHIPLGVAICQESTLPGHMRLAAKKGAVVVVVLANDQWLPPSVRMHPLRLTALRGLEIGRDVLVAANGGFSAHLRDGKALALAGWEDPPLAVQATLNTRDTPWTRWGYRPLAALTALWGMAGWLSTGKSPRRKPRSPGKF